MNLSILKKTVRHFLMSLALLTTLALVGVDAGLSTAEATLLPAYPEEGTYALSPVFASNMELAVKNAGVSDHTRIVIDESAERINQDWILRPVPGTPWYFIISAHTGKAIDNFEGRAQEGNLISLWNPENSCQMWRFWESDDGTYIIQANTTGTFVLDVDNAKSNPGTKVQLWSYNDTVAQKWVLRRLF